MVQQEEEISLVFHTVSLEVIDGVQVRRMACDVYPDARVYIGTTSDVTTVTLTLDGRVTVGGFKSVTEALKAWLFLAHAGLIDPAYPVRDTEPCPPPN